MYTLNSQPIFNPMQSTLFKSAHTGTCMDTIGYDINSMVALSNLIQLNNNNKMKEQIKNDNLDQNLIPNIISNNSLLTAANLQQLLLANQTTATSTTANLLNGLNNKTTGLTLSYYQQLQEMPTNLFNLQNSSALPTANSVTLALLANELSKSTTSNQLNNRPIKKQKTIPNPLQLTYSNLNPNQQNEPLDLSIKSASSTASDHFLVEPLNLSRSNTPEDDDLDKTIIVNSKNSSSSLINSNNTNLVQIHNALCKKKKIMAQQAAELLKKSSFSSAPNSPSSIATSSSPSDQPFDLDGSHSNQSNLNFLTNETSILNQLNKKRKFSDSSLNLNSSTNSIKLNLESNKLPKLQAKRRLNKQRKTSINSEESIELSINQEQHKPNTIIIDAKNTFTCSICGEMFAFKDRLSKHIKSKHRNQINLNNNQNQNDNLNDQQSPSQSNGRNSPNQRNYVCKTCNRAFARSDMLTRHSRLHSGLKPYACDICKSYFTRSDHLATHKRTHSGEKPYQCSQCNYTACRRDMITRHMKTHKANGNKSKPSCVVLLVPTENKTSNESSTIVSSTTSKSSPKKVKQQSNNLDDTVSTNTATIIKEEKEEELINQQINSPKKDD